MGVDHHGVTCDGCGTSPLIGLRFKCTTLEDFDLCSECFCKKQSLVQGEGHEFKMIPLDWANMWWKKQDSMKQTWWGEGKEACKAWMKGKGKCKGKGKGKDKGTCKGKGKYKRSYWDADFEVQDSQGKCLKKCVPTVSEDDMPSAPPMELEEKETEQKAKKLEEMGFGDASNMARLLKDCGGDLSKALEALEI